MALLSGSFSATDIQSHDDKPPISLDSLVTLIRTPGLVYADMHTSFFSEGELPRFGFLASVRVSY